MTVPTVTSEDCVAASESSARRPWHHASLLQCIALQCKGGGGRVAAGRATRLHPLAPTGLAHLTPARAQCTCRIPRWPAATCGTCRRARRTARSWSQPQHDGLASLRHRRRSSARRMPATCVIPLSACPINPRVRASSEGHDEPEGHPSPPRLRTRAGADMSPVRRAVRVFPSPSAPSLDPLSTAPQPSGSPTLKSAAAMTALLGCVQALVLLALALSPSTAQAKLQVRLQLVRPRRHAIALLQLQAVCQLAFAYNSRVSGSLTARGRSPAAALDANAGSATLPQLAACCHPPGSLLTSPLTRVHRR